MRKIFVAGIIFLFLSSCSTDFAVTTDWQDITIVYGLLDKSDTASYIKINKAFLDPTTSAYTIAQIPDSLFYNDLTVELQEYNGTLLVKTIELNKVDGNDEGLVKDTGIFAQSPNYLYKTKEVLNQSHTYKLLVTKPDNGKQITASTAIIDDFSILRPTNTLKINMLPGLKYNVDWFSAKDGKIYDLIIRFHYSEYKFSDSNFKEDKYLDWTIFTNLASNSTIGNVEMFFDIPCDNLYTFLSANIADDADRFRVTKKMDFMFSVGGEVLDTYNQVTIAQQGLTSGQVLPTYTNIENGLGLFSSRYHKNVLSIPLDQRTIDSIACYSVTHQLNFLRNDSTLCP
ncbi:MAG: hypothetical protein LH473_00120 [Chitinophagales bacterium]|nr:hypothetical protein [Chitinophagales bacterium]